MGRIGFLWVMSLACALASLGGCATPSRRFGNANWICNTQYVDAVVPGELGATLFAARKCHASGRGDAI